MTHPPHDQHDSAASRQEQPGGVEVLREASGVVAVFKPAGIATQAAAGIDSMERRLRRWLEARSGSYLGVPHRLDRPVSGVILFAVTPRAARQLSRQFERRQIVKRYAALLEPLSACPMKAEGGWEEWRDRLAKVPDEPRARLVPAEESCDEAREAVTRVRLVAADASMLAGDRRVIEVEFEPLTGRMHQLRIQAGSRGMPVLGDVLYGATMTFADDLNRCPDEQSGRALVPPIALHASRIEYLDPDTRSPVVVESIPPWRLPGGHVTG